MEVWKKLSETKDLVVYENEDNAIQVRIEARLVNNEWQVFRRYFNDMGISLTEEFLCDTMEETLTLIGNLQKEKELTLPQLENIMRLKHKKLNIKLSRAYKEYDVEKWFFSVNNEGFTNIVTVRYADEIEVDVVMHEKYHYIENKVLDELNKSLGLSKFGTQVRENVYFFNKRTSYKKYGNKKSWVVSGIGVEFGEGQLDHDA